MGETVNKSEIAEQIGKRIFKPLFWDVSPPTNINFSCLYQKPKDPQEVIENKTYHTNQGTHPMDASFSYIDPYLGKRVYLNTDFKSYSSQSITSHKIRQDLASLAETINCAQDSSEWANFVCCIDEIKEVRGLLFLYNTDYKYEHNIDYILNRVKLENLPIAKNQYIHLLDPLTINRIYSLVKDLESLENKLYDKYSFYYPNQRLSKNIVSNSIVPPLPCTIEMICSTYTVIQYEKNSTKGFLIYYNGEGTTKEEFMYLFDYLTSVQIPFNENLKIRASNANISKNIINNFRMAKQTYLQDWNFSEAIVESLKDLDIFVIDQNIPNFIETLQGWDKLK